MTTNHWSAGEGRNSPGRFPCNARNKQTTQEKIYGKRYTFFVSCRTDFACIQSYGCGLRVNGPAVKIELTAIGGVAHHKAGAASGSGKGYKPHPVSMHSANLDITRQDYVV